MRLAFVVPWPERGRWVFEYLPEEFTGDVISAAGTGRVGRLPPYLQELVSLARRRPDLDRYDAIFTWELRTTLAVALLRWRSRFVPVGPILKGPIRRVLPLVRYLLRDAARIVCFSRAECDTYARLLHLPRERFLFVPTPWRSDETISDRDDGYILALGRSNRDFVTLLRAVRGTDLPVVIVAEDPSALRGEKIPPNVCVRYRTGPQESDNLIAAATLHCIPLRDTDYSSGQTVLLRAMARGKAVVVSDTAGTRDYVQNNETAVLVPPGDVEALREGLLHLWGNAAARRRIGENAARAVREEFGFPRFAARMAQIAKEIK